MEVPAVFGKRRFVLPAIFLTLIIGGILIFNSPAFHSYAQKTSLHPNTNDPIINLWKDPNPNNDLSEWNTRPVIFVSINTTSPQSISMIGDTVTDSALSKTPVDLSQISAKALGIQIGWKTFGSCCGSGGSEWGFYLTRNGTLPTHNIGSSQNYNPLNDTSVALVESIKNDPSLGPAFFNYAMYIQKDQTKTILSQNNGCGSSGSCFTSFSTNNIAPNVNDIISDALLNFTGSNVALTNGCPQASQFNGANCSIISFRSSADLSGAPRGGIGTQQTPQFKFQGVPYYVGLYFNDRDNTGMRVAWRFDDPTYTQACLNFDAKCMQMDNLVLSTSALYDTGGFFGPLFAGFYAFLQLIISGLSFFYNLISPVLSLAISVLTVAFATLFNAIGGLFGDGSFGTQIVNFLSGISSFLINILVNAITYFTNSVITAAVDLVNITQTVFGEGNAFIGPILGFFQGLGSLIPAMSAFLQQLLAFYSVGVFGVSTIMIVWTTLGALSAVLDWIESDNPLAAFISVFLTGFLLYMLTLGNTLINPVASNAQVLGSYQTAYTNTVFFFDMMPIFFFSILINWASAMTETGRRSLHSSGSQFGLPHFTSFITTSRMLTVDLFKAGYWFFKESFDIVAKAIAAIKGRWSPVEVLGTG